MGKNRQNVNYKDYKKRQDQKKQKYGKWASAFIYVVAPMFFVGVTAVYPLFFWKSKYYDITYDKTLFFWIFTAVFAGALLLALFFKKCLNAKSEAETKEKTPASLSVAKWALAAFLSFSLLSALASIRLPWGEEVKETVWFGYPGRYEGFISFFCYGIVFFIIAKFYKPKSWHFLVVAASAVIVSLYGILQFSGIDIFELFPHEIPEYAGYGPLSAYFRTTLGNVNIVSAYCTFAVVLFAALFAVSETFFKWDIFYLAASAISFALMLIANGDASYLAVAVSMVLVLPYWISDRNRLGKIFIVLAGWCAAYLWFDFYISGQKELHEIDPSVFTWADQRFLNNYAPINMVFFAAAAAVLLLAGLALVLFLKKWPKRVMKIAGIAFLPAALIAGIIFVEFAAVKWAETPNNILWQLREIMHGNFDDKFGSGRGWVWKRGFSVLFDRPIFGSGPDAFYYALGNDLQLESLEVNRVYFDKAHNIFLQIAVCMGIPALLSYLAFLGGLFASAVKKAFGNPLILAFGAAAVSYTIQSFFCVEVPLTTPLVWVCFGVMAGEALRKSEKGE
ncbi:MAG: O-antigen ligase family protein [Oscillospiraceae bacterium]|nr:O-antigen ligase family protein [Oscillospiraceae bacterium]